MQYQLKKIYSDYANVHQVCREALALSDSAKIEAVLIGGSLLGMIRDKDLLPWDKDVDFAIFEPDISSTLALEDAFRRGGFECRVHHLGVRPESELILGVQLLKNICHLLSKLGVEHCIITGALLNLLRDQTLNKETDTLALLLNLPSSQLKNVQCELETYGRVYINGDSFSPKSLTLITQEWRVNLFLYTEQDKSYGWTDLNCEHWFSEPLFPAKKLTIDDFVFNAPNTPEAFLQARYGDKWQNKPRPVFSSGRVTGSMQLYKDGVMVDYIVHYIRGEKTYWFEPKANVISTKGFVPYSKQHTTIGHVYLPDYPEIFLQEHYGDWCTPVKKWDGAVDNPTIMDSDLAMKRILAGKDA